MPVTPISQNILLETIRNEIPLTGGFKILSRALLDIAGNCIAKGLKGKSEDACSRESPDKYR